MKFLATLSFVLLAVVVSAQKLISTGASGKIEIENHSYKLVINKKPAGFKIIRGGQVVSELSEPNGFSFMNGNQAVSLSEVSSFQLQGKTLFLKMQSADGKIKSDLAFALSPSKIDLSWTLPEFEKISNMKLSFRIDAGKHWYGGHVTSGHNWPLETAQVSFDPLLAHSNQATPFWLSASGVGYYLPTYKTMGFTINNQNNGNFEVFLKGSRRMDLQLLIGENSREAYKMFARAAGLPQVVPPKAFFEKPQFNTWIEYMKNVDQEKILDYARKIRQNDFPCEVLMVDAGWHPIHGEYEFIPEKFPDPKAMVDELHRMGFKIMLWVSPYVRKGSANFDFLASNGYLIKDEKGINPGQITWWGGTDYEIDMSNPDAFAWFVEKLRKLQREYGIDGFKQDGGDTEYIPESYKTFTGATPNHSTDYWAKLGDYFEYNEYRVSWMAQSSGLVQRLRDKHITWTRESGLGSLVPNGLISSLLGYSYFCPDMIGGGDAKDFRDPNYKGMGTELFIRWTQASALMPMMQFSYAPWNLDADALKICRKYAKLHEELGGYIYELALKNQKTGDPIVRPLFYDNTEDEQAYLVSDQFMLGDRFLVAPVLEKGAVKRNIYLPKGLWKDYWTNTIYTGGVSIIDYSAPIDVLPILIKLD
jgi:alpha-glucosidase